MCLSSSYVCLRIYFVRKDRYLVLKVEVTVIICNAVSYSGYAFSLQYSLVAVCAINFTVVLLNL